jgi:transposase
MLQIHPNARTTPAVRAEIARSGEPSGVLAKRYGVSTETVRKWRKRGPEDCLDRSAKPHRLPWKATDEERAVVCALRRSTNFALDDLTFVVVHFLPHLNRDSVWRILRAEGLGRRRPPPSTRPARGQGSFRDHDLGFVHIDIKHLPKLQTGNGQRRKSGASATSTSPSTAARAPCTWRSRTTRRRRAPSRSSARPRRPSPSASPTC